MISDAFDPDLLRAYLAVCRHGSMSRAADRAGRAQSALSTQMRRLEDLVGRQLLRRTGRGVVPTTDGEVFLGYATRILSLGEEAAARLNGRAVAGSVRIGIAEDVAVAALPAALGRLRRACPDLHLEVVIDHGSALAERWREGALDVAVAACSAFEAEPLQAWDVELHWACAVDAQPDPDRPLDVIVYGEPCPWRRLMFDALAGAGRDFRVVLTSQNLGAIASAVASGIGVALLTAESFSGETMRAFPLDPGHPPLNVRYGLYAAARRDGAVETAVGALRGSLRAVTAPGRSAFGQRADA